MITPIHIAEGNKVAEKNSEARLIVDSLASRAEEFFYEGHPVFKQLSDHYGVTTTLLI